MPLLPASQVSVGWDPSIFGRRYYLVVVQRFITNLRSPPAISLNMIKLPFFVRSKETTVGFNLHSSYWRVWSSRHRQMEPTEVLCSEVCRQWWNNLVRVPFQVSNTIETRFQCRWYTIHSVSNKHSLGLARVRCQHTRNTVITRKVCGVIIYQDIEDTPMLLGPGSCPAKWGKAHSVIKSTIWIRAATKMRKGVTVSEQLRDKRDGATYCTPWVWEKRKQRKSHERKSTRATTHLHKEALVREVHSTLWAHEAF